MSGLDLIFRIPMTLLMLLSVGVIGVFGVVAFAEPMYSAFGPPAASLGWGDPGLTGIKWFVVMILGLFLVTIIWFVAAPIQTDVRQEVR